MKVPPKKKQKMDVPKKEKKKTFVSSWKNLGEFKGWLEKSIKAPSEGNEYAFCKVCNCDIMAHKSVLLKHSKSEKHKLNLQKVASNSKLPDMFRPKADDIAVKNAEIKLCALLASNNLPFLLMDTLTPLIKNIFPDSKIANQLNLKRSKATSILCNSLGENFLTDLYSKLKEPGCFFSLIMDETTDISVKKQCAFTVIYYDYETSITKTQFFDLVEVHGSTANDLYTTLKESLTSNKILLNNFVGFSSDTTNVMVGEYHSVFSLLKEEFPHIVCVRCSCHMAHLATSKACLKLPRHVEDLLRNIGSHFNRSALRRQKFKEFQHFFQVEIHKILSPALTRWLSIKECVDRVLEQYEPLKAYLTESVFEDPSVTTDNMLETMRNPFTKVYLEFMSYTLGLMTEFNLLFQSEKPLLFKVKPETETLLKTLCSNFINISIVKNKDIHKLNHENPSNFVPLENIYLGVLATDSFQDLKKKTNIERHDLDSFLKTILSFYIELVKNIKDRFRFEDPIFKITEIIDPKTAQSFETKSLKHILDRFPILKDHVDIQALDNEWRRHALLNFEALELNNCNEPEQYWSKIFKLKNDANNCLFPNLKRVLSLLFVLPFSNASVERIFSDFFNIKTDKRNLLNTSTIKAILATKAGVDGSGGCVKFQPSKKMLECKIWQDKK